MASSDTLITAIPQIDGSTREIHAQDKQHARRARELLRQDPALAGLLGGIDGIRIRIVDRRPR